MMSGLLRHLCHRYCAARATDLRRGEDGQTLLLGIGVIAVVTALLLVVAGATAVYLDLKTLTSLADSAAAAAVDGVDEESIMMAVLDAGAEEVEDAGELFIVESDTKDVVAVRSALQDAGIDYDSAEVQFVASTEVELDLEGALKVNKLIDVLEDSDDVQNVFTNLDLTPEVAAALESGD